MVVEKMRVFLGPYSLVQATMLVVSLAGMTLPALSFFSGEDWVPVARLLPVRTWTLL